MVTCPLTTYMVVTIDIKLPCFDKLRVNLAIHVQEFVVCVHRVELECSLHQTPTSLNMHNCSM